MSEAAEKKQTPKKAAAKAPEKQPGIVVYIGPDIPGPVRMCQKAGLCWSPGRCFRLLFPRLQSGQLYTGTASGHVAVAQRRGSERKPIKAFSANSIPVMLGNEKRVYGVVKPHIKENLKRNVQAQVTAP